MTVSNAAKQVRLRLKEDFEFYAEKCLKIRTKAGESSPLRLNKVQRELLNLMEKQHAATGKIRVVVLKGRQQGLSTFAAAYLYFRLSQSFNKKGLIVAHKHESTKAIFDMINRMHSECPSAIRPSERVSRRTEKVFDKLGTGLIVATAGGDGVARGETITHAMLSEVGHWPAGTAAEVLNALVQSIPNTPDTAIIVESTAMGFNLFKDLYDGANRGDTGFLPFFAPWFWSDEYREPPHDYFERTMEEDDLCAEHGLDDAQLQWRRNKISLVGRQKFEQEYPATAEEAFKASGSPVFNPADVEHQQDRAKPLLKKMRMNPTNSMMEDFPVGELSVYVEHDPGDLYTIGADVALGVPDGDFSVAQVLNSKMEVVATWRGKIHPKAYAGLLDALGRYYVGALGQPARLAVENNSFGHVTTTALHDLAYPNLFTELRTGTFEGDIPTETLGFRSTSKTKPLIIGRLIGALSDRSIVVNDEQTIDELFTYVITEAQKMTAQPGRYDDCVMALAIAAYAWEGLPELIDPEWISNSFYEAI